MGEIQFDDTDTNLARAEFFQYFSNTGLLVYRYSV